MTKTFTERFTIARECYYGFSLMQELEKLFCEVDGTINALKEQNQVLLEELAEINLKGKDDPKTNNPALVKAAERFLKAWPINKMPDLAEYELMGQLAQDILNRQS